MVYHKDADHSLHMALSRDGYSWTALNNDRPIVNGDSIAQQRGIRDPHIYRAPDGTFYVAAGIVVNTATVPAISIQMDKKLMDRYSFSKLSSLFVFIISGKY